MKARPLTLLLSLALAIAGEAQILGARPLAAASRSLIFPPNGATAPAVTPATLGHRVTQSDGTTVAKQVINFTRSAALEIDALRLKDWKPAGSRQFSVFWTYWFNPDVRFGINIVTGPAARNLMDGSGWNSVPSAMERDAKDGFRVLVNDDSESNTAMIRLFGWRTRVYQCEIIPAEPNTQALSQLVVTAGDENQAYLFVLEGTTRQVTALQAAFASIITWMEPADLGPPS